MTNYKSNSVLEYFNDSAEFSLDGVMHIYQLEEPEITKNAVMLRINHLVKKGLLSRTGKGLYALGKKLDYKPIPDTDLQKLYRKLINQFPYAKFCVWNTKLFNEFMIHQPGRFYTLIETEKDTSEFVFNYLKKINNEVFLNPNEKILRLYALNSAKCFLVKDLVSETPTQTIENTPTITIEKMLVDVFCDNIIFNTQQGSELDNIFVGAFTKYNINKTKLFRYSNRRTKKQQIEEYLNQLKINW